MNLNKPDSAFVWQKEQPFRIDQMSTVEVITN